MPGEQLFAPIFTTDELLAATGDGAWLQAMLDAEAALAGAQAEYGLVPVRAAEAIAAVCDARHFDLAQLGRDARGGGNPVIPLVGALSAMVAPEARAWVHWGATSQDILDTAAMLVAKRALLLIGAHLDRLGTACAVLTQRHEETVMAGRTLLQQALPITFGLKAAGWLSGTDAARVQLVRSSSDLAAQLGGAVGTLASLGPQGPEVVAAFARRVGLAEPVLPWHTARQRVAALAGALGVVAGTAAKVSGDVALLMQSEVGEAFEPAPGGSSTLPHKRNPASGAVVVAAARRAHALLPVLFGALIGEHERPVGAWHAEWQPLSELLALAGGAVARTADTVAGLDVRTDAMAANVARTGGAWLSERVVLMLAAVIGDRDRARLMVTEALASTRPFADALADDPMIAALFDRDEIDELLDPAGYLGAATTWVERALAEHEKGLP